VVTALRPELELLPFDAEAPEVPELDVPELDVPELEVPELEPLPVDVVVVVVAPLEVLLFWLASAGS
jgi:hypothetical protein